MKLKANKIEIESMGSYKENPKSIDEALHNVFVTVTAIQFFISVKKYDLAQDQVNVLQKNCDTVKDFVNEIIKQSNND